MSDPMLAKSAEADPNGIGQHAPGAKLDAGKVRVGLVLFGFARALEQVARVGTQGAEKYSDNGWMHVPDGVRRYTDAMLRHLLAEAMGERIDPATGLSHAAHGAWNALARLDLMLRDRPPSEFSGPERVRWNDQLGAEVDDAIHCASATRDMGARLSRAG